MIKPFLCICCIAANLYLFATTIAPGITAVYDAKKKVVNIQWQQKQPGIKSYVVQRSTDNSTWTDIAFQGIVNYDPGKTFQFVDYRAANGENYYRLKCVTEKAQIEYSTSIMVIAGAAESNWIMYPVPVKDVLTLQYKGANKIMGVVNVFIHIFIGKPIIYPAPGFPFAAV